MTWYDCPQYDPIESEKRMSKYRPDMTYEEKMAEYKRTMIAPPDAKVCILRNKKGKIEFVNEYDLAWCFANGYTRL